MDKEGESVWEEEIKTIVTICTVQQSVSSISPQNRWVTQTKELRAIDLDDSGDVFRSW